MPREEVRPGGTSPASILALQGAAGNQATGAYLQRARARDAGGLPTDLKANVETLSGMSLDGVRVHYGSREPGEVGAHAFTRGSEIHVAPGQDRHLPHEAWHVVQQRQSRVRPTAAVNGQALNDDGALEREAVAMGDRALQRMPENARPPRSLRRATVDEPVLQGEWAEAPPNYTEQAARADPLGALLSLVGPYRGILGEEIAALEDLRAGYLNANLNAVVGGLAATLDRGEWGTATLIVRASEAASDRDEADDEHDTNAPETVIDFSNLHEYVNPAEVNSGDAGLRAIFARMASGIGKVATEQAFQRWYNSPVLTRDAFARLFDGESSEPMQQARVAGALSYQAGYTGSSGKQYTSVTYKLGNRGSIDFQAPKSSKKWSDPVDTKTLVNLQKGSAKKGEGITKNGTAVNIKNASRSQHFSIANRIRNIEGSGSPTGWTWHHIETPYLMVLVDRIVHSKHGHNGGFFLW